MHGVGIVSAHFDLGCKWKDAKGEVKKESWFVITILRDDVNLVS